LPDDPALLCDQLVEPLLPGAQRMVPSHPEHNCPIRIRTILTDRLFDLRKRAPPVSINSISSVQLLTSSTASHPQSCLRQMAGSSASTVVSAMSSKAITSDPVKK